MQQWLIETLETKLGTVFATLIPGSEVHRVSGTMAIAPDDSWVWRGQSFRVAPDAVLSVGLSESSRNEIATVGRQSGWLGGGSHEDAEETVLRLLLNACATIVSAAVDGSEPIEGRPEGSPLLFALELNGGTSHIVAAHLSPSLVSAIDVEFEDEEMETQPGPVLLNLNLPVSISLGHTRMEFRDLLRLSTGSVVELDRMVGDPVDLTVNDSVIARGEIVVVEGYYGVRIQTVSGAACRSATGFPGGC